MAAAVTAVHSLLSVPDVAQELNTTSIHILRLITIGKLSARRAGQDVSDWRITGESLAAYMVRSEGFEAVNLDERDGWFDAVDNGLNGAAANFVAQIRSIIRGMMPEDFESLPAAVQKSRTFIVPLTAAMRSVADSVPSPFIRFAHEKTPPAFGTLLEQYCASKLREHARYISEPSVSESLSMTRLTKLYASPEAFRAAMDYCHKKWAETSIFDFRNYPSDPTAAVNQPRQVTFKLPHTALSVSLDQIVAKAF